ncbi:hypothetical protein DID76_03530 [Candidatus Marinamargulisbacteria bacterium SCGC AG-414-C22]|nr:hypothetical protein DID76_03530 [Candidatus Marinamargulisbacteria bacterium SCGC AG-414-C22]
MAEQRRRSIAKVISWRATATLTTVVISYLITGKMDFALKIGIFEVFAKLLLQYFHERLWNCIKFGVSKNMDYQI